MVSFPQTMRLCLPTALLAGLASVASPLHAQAVRGTVGDPSTGAAIDGAIVVLIDEQGQTVGQVLSNDSGRFLLRAPEPGRYSLRADRIGHASTFSETFALTAGQTLVMDLMADVEAIELAGIDVDAERQCVLQPSDDGGTALLWEEARKALTATAWTAESGVYRYELLYRSRQLDRDARRVESESTRRSTALRQQAFVSRPAEFLEENGYTARDSNGDRLYFAPDAAVLLSDSFLRTHCFTVREGRRESEGLIGLGFEPVPDRRLPDIDGTLWLDPATAELRWIDFRYRNLDSEIFDDAIGGRVEFTSLPTGPWFVNRWSIRMPILQRQGLGGNRGPRLALVGVAEEGAQVVGVRDARGGRMLDFETGAVSGSVRSEFGREGLAAARVFLVGTDHSVFTDEAGRFRITGLDAGIYEITYSHASTDSIGFTPEPVPVEVTIGRATAVSLEAPSRYVALTEQCTEEDTVEGMSMLLGYVRDIATGEPLTGAAVRVMWSNYSVGSAQAVSGGRGAEEAQRTGDTRASALVVVGEREQGFQTSADDRGFYLFCSVPNNHPLRVTGIWGDDESREIQIRIERNALYRSYDVEMRRDAGPR